MVMEKYLDEELERLGREERERWTRVEPIIEEIALKASYMPEFQSIVDAAKSRVEAVAAVRVELSTHFPELSKLEEPAIAGVPSNDYKAAVAIVRLLWKNK